MRVQPTVLVRAQSSGVLPVMVLVVGTCLAETARRLTRAPLSGRKRSELAA